MEQFKSYKIKKISEKESARSRIPRPMPQHFCPRGSPMSELILSEEEGKEYNTSTNHTERAISPNCYSSDDTGCPSSQCASPTKMNNPPPVETKTKVKRVRVNVMAEWDAPAQKHKRDQQRPTKLHRGSEADFSSSSSSGSLKSRGSLLSNSTGKKILSHSCVQPIRSRPVFKPPGSPTTPRDADLYAPYRTPPKSHLSSHNGNNSSPISRRTKSGRYHSCGDNHGIRPPNPEQYLTPLQQKEVTIRHLRTKLQDSEQIVCDRDSEIQDLKSQMGRMREDWIEEECHRVEAQLALKEARKEIKQLRQVVETMKNSLMEKDKGIQKYFVDINIQNRKLESLLHSMELAQSGANLHEESTLDFICVSPEKQSTGKLEDKLHVADQAMEELADSGLLVNDDLANQMDILEKVLMSTAMESSHCNNELLKQPLLGVSTLVQSASEKSLKYQNYSETTQEGKPASDEKAIQTDEIFYPADIQALLLSLLKLQNTGVSGPKPASKFFQKIPKVQEPNFHQVDEPIINLPQAPDINHEKRLHNNANASAPPRLVFPQNPGGLVQSLEPGGDPVFMEELDFGVKDDCSAAGKAVVGKNYWSNRFLVDLATVAAPVLPTVAWLYSQHDAVGGQPVYNIAALIRGCCIVGLHSLRLVTYGPHI